MMSLRNSELGDVERLEIGETLLADGAREFTHDTERAKFVAQVMAIMQGIRDGSTEAEEQVVPKVEMPESEPESEQEGVPADGSVQEVPDKN